VAEDATRPRRVTGLTGLVTRGPFATGSKSEREAIWLETDEGRFVLRRKDGPSFGDRSFDGFVGQRVSCDGFIIGYTMLAERIAPAP
jgi:hypothetical protein